MNKFVVYSPGRTGSTLITRELNSYFKIWYVGTLSTRTAVDVPLVTTHNPLFQVRDPENYIAIISKRRSLFNTIISKIIADYTKEYTEYTKKDISSINISSKKFTEMYHFCKLFYMVLDTSKFKQTVVIDIEDLLADSKFLFAQLGIDHNMIYKTEKSPYGQNFIDNHNDCKILFDELERTPISDSIIESYTISLQNNFKFVRN
jgi:hypothetical protein